MPLANDPQNTSIPPHLNKWNWGAFWLNWIWGLAHGTFIALLMFVPLVNFVMIFILGAKGSQWAWENRIWRDEAHFVKSQRTWGIIGWCLFVFSILFFVGTFFAITGILKNTDAYKQTLETIRSDSRVIEVMGTPIEDGFLPSGNVSISGANSNANFEIAITGPKCEGTVYSRLRKPIGEWEFTTLVVRFKCNDETHVIINKDNFQVPGERGARGA